MTQRAMQIIKELAELNDKVSNLETELKQELFCSHITPSDLLVMTEGKTYKDWKEDRVKEIKEEERQNRIKQCIEYGEPISEDDKRYLKDLNMPRNEFLNDLYLYGYYSIEDLFWNYKSRITTYN